MKVCVIGNGKHLEDHCRAALENLSPGSWEVFSSPAQPLPPAADVYVWDFEPESFYSRLSPEVVNRALFAVEPDDIEVFRKLIGTTRASILLKPVRPASIQPFLEHAAR